MGWLINSFRFLKYNLYSFLFDGVNEYMTVPDDASLGIANTQSNSYSFWAYFNDLTNTQIILSKYVDSGDDIGMIIYISSSDPTRLSVIYAGSGTTGVTWIKSTSTFTLSTWTHVLVTKSNSNANAASLKIYLNGVVETNIVNQDLLGNASIANNGNFEIGSRLSGNLPFNGYIDEVSIWNKELSVAEVTELYNSGKPKNLSTHSAVANLVSWWRMGDGATWGGVNWTVPDVIKYKYLNFDGVNESLNIGTGLNSLLDYGNSFSISIWCKRNVLNVRHEILGNRTFSSPNKGINLLFFSDNKIYFQLYENGATSGLSCSTPLAYTDTTNFQHIVVTYNGGSGVVIYYNGVNVGALSYGQNNLTGVINSTYDLFIGKPYDNLYYYNGNIDDVSIYDKVLSSTEVTELYTKGRKETMNYTALSFSADCVMYNKMGSLNPIDETGVNNATSVNQEIADVIEAVGNNATSVNMELGDRTTVVP